MSVVEQGVLYIVATPIGHLADAGGRALQVLREVDVIAAEDTRHSARLLRHFGIATPAVALHEHNERTQTPRLIARLRAGESVALVSDAGTPIISDPGHHLVSAAHDAGVRVAPIPGPSAVMAALSVCGLAVERFAFEGFLPPRESARARRLEELSGETRTLVFFEAPHRVAATLDAMVDAFGAVREACLAREITKVHETVRRATLGELARLVHADATQRKGEIVLVVAGATPVAGEEGEREARRTLSVLLDEGLPVKQAAAVAARLTGVPRNRLYRWALGEE